LKHKVSGLLCTTHHKHKDDKITQSLTPTPLKTYPCKSLDTSSIVSLGCRSANNRQITPSELYEAYMGARGAYDAPTARGAYDAPTPRARAYDAPTARGAYDAPTARARAYDAPTARGAYDAPTATTQTPHIPSASTYLSWAQERDKSIDSLPQAVDKAPYVTQAADFAKKSIVLGEKSGVSLLNKIFASHTVPSTCTENDMMRTAHDSRINSKGDDGALFWAKVQQKLEGRISPSSTPVMPRYASPSVKPQNYEIAAEFITESRAIIDRTRPLPESFVTKWMEHFDNATTTRKLPNFEVLKAEYEAAIEKSSLNIVL
jgi:hypothetical protein